ncbi:MAG: efflux transporter periplasmic adaptor subunit [Bacteroidetes bacterium]|nr:MAG: efflux transporter periplasmic adaptor subunit [Bacteroidota bacterium]
MQSRIRILFKGNRPIVLSWIFVLIAGMVLLQSCGTSSGSPTMTQPIQSLPVISVSSKPVTTYREYTATIEGTKNIEIRPQVDGYLDKIFVDEGAYVKKGQTLFKINDQPYREQLNTANASLQAAKASLENAQINVNKLTPLVQNNVISDVQLKTAQAAYNAAKANVEQAAAQVNAAQINVGYTVISAPVNGYIGRIPSKTGSLVTKNQTQALTMLSEVKDIYAYFSLSETDFLEFKNNFKGNTLEEKIKNIPAVQLELADNTIYPQEGKVEIAEGQFDKTIGSITFRAIFPNVNGLLRSGNTGRVRIPKQVENSIVVPQESTFELQDKIFVYTLADSNKVTGRPITVAARSGNYYLVDKGLKPGEKIVYTGLDRLRDGMPIIPETISMDSLLKLRPL